MILVGGLREKREPRNWRSKRLNGYHVYRLASIRPWNILHSTFIPAFILSSNQIQAAIFIGFVKGRVFTYGLMFDAHKPTHYLMHILDIFKNVIGILNMKPGTIAVLRKQIPLPPFTMNAHS